MADAAHCSLVRRGTSRASGRRTVITCRQTLDLHMTADHLKGHERTKYATLGWLFWIKRRRYKQHSARATVNTSSLAEYLQVSKSSLYKVFRCGQVLGHKVEMHWRVILGVIDTYPRCGATYVTTARWSQDRSPGRPNGR